jgi:hypothetical protein
MTVGPRELVQGIGFERAVIRSLRKLLHGDGLVAEELLDLFQARPSHYQMAGKGVKQVMELEILNPCLSDGATSSSIK